jgi:hypothetical protein
VAFDRGGDDLLRRAEAKLGILHRNKQSVRVAVLACNAATGGPAADQRAQIARTLLGAVTRTTCGRLILGASGRASRPFRPDLVALAEALTDELEGTTATVSMQFTETPHPNDGWARGGMQATAAGTPGRLRLPIRNVRA